MLGSLGHLFEEFGPILCRDMLQVGVLGLETFVFV